MTSTRYDGKVVPFFLLVFFLTAAAVGAHLYGTPRGPDAPQSWIHVLGAFFLTCALLCSAYTLGRVILRRFFSDWFLQWAMGLGVFALLAQCFAFLGWLGFFPVLPMTLSLVLPFPLVFYFERKTPTGARREHANFPWIEMSGFALVAALFFAMTWIPDPMPDPLWYHLSAARTWVDKGSYTSASENIAYFQSGTWDALYMWTAFFLGSGEGGGLIAGQFAGQWLHFFAACLAVAGLPRVYGAFFPSLSKRSLCLVSFLSLGSVSQLNTVFLAKNDWGASLFLVAALCALLRKEQIKRRVFLAGIFFGFSASAKLSVLFAGLPLVALILYLHGELRRVFAWLALGAFLGALPWLLRNFLFQGNPLFPGFASLFPGVTSPSWNRLNLYEGKFLGWSGKYFLAKQIITDAPFLLLTTLSPFFFLKKDWRKKREVLFPGVIALASFFFFLKVGVAAEFRLFGPGALFMAGGGFALLLHCSRFAVDRVAFRLSVVIIALSFLTYFHAMPWNAPREAFAQESPPEEIRKHHGGTVSAWIRLHLSPEARVASVNEFRVYYLLHRGVYRVWDRPSLDRNLYAARTLKEILAALRGADIEYLILTNRDWDHYYRKEVLDVLEKAVFAFPGALVFGNRDSKVIDLAKLSVAAEGK